MVKPKSKKQIEKFKSLRLKTAVSANPECILHWDRNGILLETGNKFSIYNDGDFYFLEVHHVSEIDTGFYNCTATNSKGIAICTSEIEVLPIKSESKKSSKHIEMCSPTFIEVLPGRKKVKFIHKKYF